MFECVGHVYFVLQDKIFTMMLKQQLTSEVSGIILDHVRETRGRLTLISDATRINRKHFNVRGFSQLKVHQMLRIIYALAVVMTNDEFHTMAEQLRRTIQDYADDYDYQLLDE